MGAYKVKKGIKSITEVRYVNVYSKDRRIYNILGQYLEKVLDTGSYASKEPYNEGELEDIIPLVNVHPLGYKQWLFKIDNHLSINKKIAEQLKQGEMANILLYADSFKKYRINEKLFGYPSSDYKGLTYITFNYKKFLFFQSIMVEPDNRLSRALGIRVVKAYRTRPEKIIDLLYVMKKRHITKYGDVVQLLGSTANTQASFLIKLLTCKIKSEKSKRILRKNRYKDIEDLAEQIGYLKLRGYLLKTLRDIYFVKEQIQNNNLYKDINKMHKDPVMVDRYQEIYGQEEEMPNLISPQQQEIMATQLNRNIPEITNMPISRIVLLMKVLNQRRVFKDSLSTYNFVFEYLEELDSYQMSIDGG